MSQVAPRPPCAGRARTCWIHRAGVSGVLGVAQIYPARRRPHRTVPSRPCRGNAVELIHPQGDRLQQAHGITHPHQVAGPVHGQQRHRGLEGLQHLSSRLAHRQSADAVAIELQLDSARRALRAQHDISSPLDDAEQGLAFWPRLDAVVVGAGSGGPRRGAVDGQPKHLWCGWQRGADIEHHLDVGTDETLDLHRFLGGQPGGCPVVHRSERHTVVVHLRPQRVDLEPPGVRQGVSGPSSKPVQSAQGCHYLSTGPQHQVVRVGQDNFGTQPFEISAVESLDRPSRPYRHERRDLIRPSGREHPAAPGRTVCRRHLDHQRVHCAPPSSGRSQAGTPLGPSRVTTMASPKERNR